MPVPPSVPLTVTETVALNQPAQLLLLQVIDFVGAVRSESPLFAALLPLVKVPPPVTCAWMTYSYVPSDDGVSLYESDDVEPIVEYGPPTAPRMTM